MKTTTAFLTAFLCLLTLPVAAADAAVGSTNTEALRAEIERMKELPRGPFTRLRWFCADGSILPPKPYACTERGGGRQHGEYSDTTRAIREAGFPIANLLIETPPSAVTGSAEARERLKAILLEQFLIGYDDGWIYRKARFYRGAIQHEDEQRAGQEILETLAASDEWLENRFLVLREAVRLLPHDAAHLSVGTIRGLAAAIADRDAGFRGLRGKIHGRPDAADAERVREYARTEGDPEFADDYRELADAIDKTFAANDVGELLETALERSTSERLSDALAQLRQTAPAGSEPAQRMATAATGMALIRAHLNEVEPAASRVSLLDTSLELERIAFVAGRETAERGHSLPRRALLDWIGQHVRALYGSGLLSAPELREVEVALEHIDDEPLELACYRKELNQLGRVSQWAGNRVLFHFGEAIERLAAIEPKTDQFVADRLRGSQLLAFDATHELLALDAQSASDVRHEVFGRAVPRGLRSLNPGLARGTLYVATHATELSAYDAHGIYIVPQTIAKLPPVAGVLTRSEGNALSHVQLLARNLGIPNIVVDADLMDQLLRHVGERVVVAASTGGVVRITRDSFEWDNVFRAGAEAERAPLRVDLDKLDLEPTSLLSLASLRAADSGRVAGPKAAKLGELMARFPGQVSSGLVIPFGIYRQLLEEPVRAGSGEPMFTWMKRRYEELAETKARDVALYDRELDRTLAFIRSWFDEVGLPPGFEAELRRAMEREFGPEGTYGLFVRSDTNVEDLEGFSGAGLNLTVPNVVGFDETLAAIRRVWASPFTARAFGWRQSLMDRPEHVYASVLLQVGVPAEKSGVLVTKDLDSGDRSVATVVVNEGVGGGVDGQLAETLTIGFAPGDDRVRRLSSATATERAVLLAVGGVAKEPVDTTDAVLTDAEIEALRKLARIIPERIAEFAPRNDGLETPAADVEFGFRDGKLWLFQIRPLVESGGANRNDYLNALDAGLRETAERLVDLDEPPLVTTS